METRTHTRGQSLMEILFAIVIFTIGVVAIGYLILDSSSSLRYGTESAQARLLAAEGMAALQSLRDARFENIPDGTYGLGLTGGVWSLVPAPDVHGKFTRTITISLIDADTKVGYVVVSWVRLGAHEKSVILGTQLTNWMQTRGAAGMLGVDIGNALLNASGTILSGVAVENIGIEPIVISGMIVDWAAPALLTRITLEGVDVFTASTSAPTSTGTYIDIVDYTLGAYSGLRVFDAIAFNGSVRPSNFIVTFILTDGSKRYVPITP